VVLLQHIEPEVAVIREIPFGLGLNLIVTAQPAVGSVEALGHDVGKTLLTRLIRYLLGEAKYADARTRTAIRRALPDSFVVGEIRVAGQNWVVMRPLGAPPTIVTRACRTDKWRDILSIPGTEGDIEAFLQSIKHAVLDHVLSPRLTSECRPIAWLDVLAWIARDQKCRYAHPLVWRHADTDSGTPVLHTEDASTVVRSLCGLMSAKEKDLFEKHDKLLGERYELAKEKIKLKELIETEENGLHMDLQKLLKADAPGLSEIGLEALRTKTDSLKGLRNEEVRKLNLDDLRKTFATSMREVADAEAKEKSLIEQINVAEAHIKKKEERPNTLYEDLAVLCDRQTDDCPMKLKIAQQQIPMPDQEELADMERELKEQQDRLQATRTGLPKLHDKLSTDQKELNKAETQLSTVTEGIDRLVALYENMEYRVDRHINRAKRLTKVVEEHDDLHAKVEQSLEQQSKLREALAASREWLSIRFEALCKELIGASRRFSLTFETKAIRLNKSSDAATPGEATSTSALVLSLDLAAIQSAIDGHGHHPRLMILDSPREADMEIGIFNRLMRQLAIWHKASPTPPFQMIVTTTTKPQEADIPSDVVRVELSRIPTEKLLLGVDL